ncbi:MAG: hypothetical protein H7099_15590 [Gemmatimonadaceae bacterium]|nr:hypothetical protein [Gemmatimonadaceae bacterium]
MQFNRNTPKLATIVAASVLALTACSDETPSTAAARQNLSAVPLELDVSSAKASVGSKIAVSVKVEALPGSLGGVQGALEFDPTRLRYVGQSPTGDAITMTGAKNVSAGKLRFTSFNQKGITGRVATFVFETKGAGYMSSLRYVHQVAATAGANLRSVKITQLPTAVDEALSVPADAREMGVADWAARIDPAAKAGPAVSLVPGQYRLNLVYGDTDLDGSVGLFDFLGVANAAVGNDQIIVGTDAGTGIDLVIAGNVFPQNVASPLTCGTESDGTRILDLFDYLAVANKAAGLPEDCAGNPIPGRGPIPTARTNVSGDITTSATWTKDRIWQLDGKVTIKDGVVLTIEAGTRIEGNTLQNPSALLTERGGVLLAAGTLNEPIVFTCTGTKVPGCWGGLWLSGKSAPNVAVPATGTGLGASPPFAARSVTFQNVTYSVGADAGGCNQLLGEANTPPYGGCSDNDFSGVLKYVRIEYAGFIVSANRELNGLTLAGVGSQTVIQNVQVHGGSDDGVEFFAGTVPVRNVVITGAQDDGFDGSFGYRANSQFVIIQNDQGDTPGNDSRAIEFDNNETSTNYLATPRTAAGLYNFTVIGNLTSAGQTAAIMLRRGTGPTISSSLFDGWRYMVEIRDAETCAPGGPAIRFSTFVGYSGGLANPSVPPACASVEDAIITTGTGNLVRQTSAPQIGAILIDGRNTTLPDWRMLSVGANPVESQTEAFPAGLIANNYRGAVAPQSAGQIPWYSGWTRGFTSALVP